jgi:hypothetical protein
MRNLLIVSILLLTACIQSEIQSFTDPDYKEAKFTRLIVDTTSLSDSARIGATRIVMQRLKEAHYDVIDINELLPPTRTINPEDAQKLLSESGYDYILRINVTGNDSSTYVAGIYSSTNAYATTNASATRFGNMASGQAHTYGHADTYTTPIISSHGQTSLEAVIYDSKNMNKAWQATILTKAGGTAFVGNVNAIAHSAIGKIIDQLKEDSHS